MTTPDGPQQQGENKPKGALSQDTEPCLAALNIAGAHYPCEDTGGPDHGVHRNKDAQAIWSSHAEVEGTDTRMCLKCLQGHGWPSAKCVRCGAQMPSPDATEHGHG